MKMKRICLCISLKVFILLSFWKILSLDIEFWFIDFFPFISLKISLSWLLIFLNSDKKSALFSYFYSSVLNVSHSPPPWLLYIFFATTDFQQNDCNFFYVFLHLYPALLYWVSWIFEFIRFHKIWEIVIISLNIFSVFTFLFPLILNNTYMLDCWKFSTVHKMSAHLVFSFFVVHLGYFLLLYLQVHWSLLLQVLLWY